MKKLMLLILFVSFILVFGYAFINYPEITNKIFTLSFYFLLGFWFWGQVFIEYDTEIFPFFFLVLKFISQNVKSFIFLFSLILLSMDSMYLKFDILACLIAIIIFFPTLSKINNDEYLRKSILLVGISVIIILDLSIFKTPNLSFKLLSISKKSYGLIALGIYFSKTILHSLFYVLIISCFYEAFNDYFYRDKNFTFKSVLLRFIKKLNKNLKRWDL